MIHPFDRETEYFRKEDAEKRSKKRADLVRQVKDFSLLGAKDVAIGERIQALGFSGQSAAAFHLLPLVFVAWADGSVTRSERSMIFRALEVRGHTRESEAGHLLETLLEEMPSQQYHREALLLLKEVAGEKLQCEDLRQLCEDVAEVSGGWFGFSSISEQERKEINTIVDAISSVGQQTFKKQMSTS